MSAGLAYHKGQDLNWDLLNYHYYDGYAFVHDRLSYDLQPAQFQTYDNPLMDVPGYLLIAHLHPAVASMVIGATQGINLWIIFEISLLLLSRIIRKRSQAYVVSFGIASFSIFGAAFNSELGNTMGDSLTSILCLSALFFLMRALDIGTKTKPHKTGAKVSLLLRIAAFILVGLAVGLKLTNAVYAVSLLAAGMLVRGGWAYKLKQAAIHVGVAGAAMAVSSGFWYWRLWQMFKNPVFPFYNGIFHSPYYAPVDFHDDRWFPPTLLGKIFYPFTFAHTQSVAADVPFRDPRFAVLFIVLAIGVITYLVLRFGFKRDHLLSSVHRAEWALWIFLGVSYVVWEKEFGYYRYIVAIELLTLLAIALLVCRLIKNIYTAGIVMLAIFIAITVRTIPMDWGRIPWQSYYFGPNLREQLQSAKGTVLTAGQDPSGFMVPYLPKGTNVIRIQGNLTYPPLGGTESEERLISESVAKNRSQGRRFYAIESSNLMDQQQAALYKFGFTTGRCVPISTYAGQYLFFGTLHYSLCDLDAQ